MSFEFLLSVMLFHPVLSLRTSDEPSHHLSSSLPESTSLNSNVISPASYNVCIVQFIHMFYYTLFYIYNDDEIALRPSFLYSLCGCYLFCYITGNSSQDFAFSCIQLRSEVSNRCIPYRRMLSSRWSWPCFGSFILFLLPSLLSFFVQQGFLLFQPHSWDNEYLIDQNNIHCYGIVSALCPLCMIMLKFSTL